MNTADLVAVFVVRIGSVPPETELELFWGTTPLSSTSSGSSTSIKSSRDSSGDDSEDSCERVYGYKNRRKYFF